MTDQIEVIDYTQHWWSCLDCPEHGMEPSRPEALAAAIKHMREKHLDEPEISW